MLINAFPSGAASNKRIELCRFTTSGTFNPADYPTADGLYDVYIVGGGGGARDRIYLGEYWVSNDFIVGGGGGYAKLLKDLKVTSTVPVTIGAAGTTRYYNHSLIDGGYWYDGSDGGNTSFGPFGTANGGKRATDSGTGGNGGCGGAGCQGLIGGLNGGDGTGNTYGSGNNSVATGVPGKGGGTVDYTPVNPYDGLMYGIGGNSEARIYYMNNSFSDVGSKSKSSRISFPPINDNPGRGGGATAQALAGVCIIYGIPKNG